jgi:hypothetical protein
LRKKDSLKKQVGLAPGAAAVYWSALPLLFVLPPAHAAATGEASVSIWLFHFVLLIFAAGACVLHRSSVAEDKKRETERAVAQRAAEDRQKWLEAVQKAPLTTVAPSQAILHPDEEAYAAVWSAMIEERAVGFEATSMNRGMAVQLGNSGVALETSAIQTAGQFVRTNVTVAHGEFVITNQRIIFAGDHKSFVVPLETLLNIMQYDDGLVIHDDKNHSFNVRQAKYEDVMIARIVLAKTMQARTEVPIASSSSAALPCSSPQP